MPCGKHHNALVMVSLSFLILLVYFCFRILFRCGGLRCISGHESTACAGPFMATSKSPSRCTSLGPHGKKNTCYHGMQEEFSRAVTKTNCNFKTINRLQQKFSPSLLTWPVFDASLSSIPFVHCLVKRCLMLICGPSPRFLFWQGSVPTVCP